MRSPLRGSLAIVVLVAMTSSVGAVDKDKAMYAGGTIAAVAEKAEGRLDTKADDVATFDAGKKGTFTIPYSAITSLEYGQNAGRRVGMAILVSPLALFSKKRNHYLTVSYRDDAGKEQAAVLELGKDIVRTTLTIFETRSGKPIEFQDEEAKKSARGK